MPQWVLRIVCAWTGLPVTSDPHRQSGPVRRKVIRKSLVDGPVREQHRRTAGGRKGLTLSGQIRKKRQRRGPTKITTSVAVRDLLPPPSFHSNVLKTCFHGSRVQGPISWEEELAIEMDWGLELLLEEEEVG